MNTAQTHTTSYWEPRLGHSFPRDLKACPMVSQKATEENPQCARCRPLELRQRSPTMIRL